MRSRLSATAWACGSSSSITRTRICSALMLVAALSVGGFTPSFYDNRAENLSQRREDPKSRGLVLAQLRLQRQFHLLDELRILPPHLLDELLRLGIGANQAVTDDGSLCDRGLVLSPQAKHLIGQVPKLPFA